MLGYTILRDGTVLATVGGSTLAYTDTIAVPGTTYTYTVEAFDAAANRSAPSSPAVVNTLPVRRFLPIVVK